MLSTVTDYILWILGVAIPQFISSGPIVLLLSVLVLGIIISYLIRLTRIRF